MEKIQENTNINYDTVPSIETVLSLDKINLLMTRNIFGKDKMSTQISL